MRVIAGSAGGIPLDAPGADVRPTMDKVRAAIFSSLGDAVPGARVLDLFAGSGSLGIEALSRGAASAVFVDSSHESARCIRRNLARARLDASIQSMDAYRFLDVYAHAGGFDLVFADPPYAKSRDARDHAGELLGHPRLPGALGEGGTFVLESVAGKVPALRPDGPWVEVRQRTYGESLVTFFAVS